MDAERAMRDGLNRAAKNAPAWDDSLLPGSEPLPLARRPRTGWIAAAACMVLVLVLGTWADWWGGPRQGIPAGTPSPARVSVALSPARGTSTLTADGTRPLVGTVWVAEQLNQPLVDQPLALRPWIRLSADGTWVGSDGCNALSGTYRVTGDRISLGPVGTTQGYCPPPQEDGFLRALEAASGFGLFPSGLALYEAGGLGRLSFHAASPTQEAPPSMVLMRLANNTGKAIAAVDVAGPSATLHFGTLGDDEASEYRVPPGEMYRYAALDVSFADGTTRRLTPTDYVGEVPLAPGRYTYVLSVQDAAGGSLAIGLEESGTLVGTDTREVTVVVSMYSGREDPTFTLAVAQVDELEACLTDAAAQSADEAAPDGLGFRYFEVRGLGDSPLLVGTGGAWRGDGGVATPVAVCDDAFAVLRRAAVANLPASEVSAIPEK